MRLIEQYLSVQGEGLHSGKLAYFVRFARCNLRCTWCDSKNTFGEGIETDFDTVTNAIGNNSAKFVCLTGGEPLLHTEDCIRLIRHFPNLHFDVETSGALDIRPVQLPNSSIMMDWKLKQSGMNHRMKTENLSFLRPAYDLLKFVTDVSEEEKSEIEEIAEKTKKLGFPISLQPVFGTDPQRLAEWMMGFKDFRFQMNLQIHKYIWDTERVRV